TKHNTTDVLSYFISGDVDTERESDADCCHTESRCMYEPNNGGQSPKPPTADSVLHLMHVFYFRDIFQYCDLLDEAKSVFTDIISEICQLHKQQQQQQQQLQQPGVSKEIVAMKVISTMCKSVTHRLRLYRYLSSNKSLP